MYTKSALAALYPHLPAGSLQCNPVPTEVFGDAPLYGKTLEDINSLLTRDPATGHVENIVSYIMKYSDATAEALTKFLTKKVAQRSPKLSDEDLLEMLIPRSVQEAGEFVQFQQTLENFLRGSISAEKAAAEKAAAEKAAAEKAAAEKAAAEKAAAEKAAVESASGDN